MQDDVGVIGRTDRGDVQLLGGEVALAPTPFDNCRQRHLTVSDHCAVHSSLGRCGHEDAQVPPVNQLGTQKEDAVEEQYGVGTGSRGRW